MLSVGYFNRIVERWIGTKAVERKDLGARTLNDIRTLPFGEFDIVDSGWHFSALGGASVMAKKMHAYSHTEADIPYLNDERRLGVDFDSESNGRWVPLDDAFPPQLRAERWSEYVWAAPAYEPAQASGLMHAHGCFAYVPTAAVAVAALVREARPVWQRAGEERFGAAFAGAHETVAGLLAAVPAGAWVVIGDLGLWSPFDLAALAAHGFDIVAYAANARSLAVLKMVIDGAHYPAGPARGLREIEAAIAAAGFRIERRDDVMGSFFAPRDLERSETFDIVAAPFGFAGTTSEAMHHFSAYAYVFRLRGPTS